MSNPTPEELQAQLNRIDRVETRVHIFAAGCLASLPVGAFAGIVVYDWRPAGIGAVLAITGLAGSTFATNTATRLRTNIKTGAHQ